MAVSQNLEFAKLDDLYLDPLNPRLGRLHSGKNVKQNKVLELMETWKIDELAISFLESGQFWTQEALICVKEELNGKERLVVVEGNRRLAALICLKEAFDGTRKDRLWKEIPDRASTAFKALGNAVNSKLVKTIAESLIGKATATDRKTVSKKVSSIHRAKKRKRIEGRDGIASEQVQEKNSLVPLGAKIKFSNFRGYMRQAYD